MEVNINIINIIIMAIPATIQVAGIIWAVALLKASVKTAHKRIDTLAEMDAKIWGRVDRINERQLKCSYRKEDYINLKMNNMKVLDKMENVIKNIQKNIYKLQSTQDIQKAIFIRYEKEFEKILKK